ncbi:MAG: hypothetical protein V4494_02355 [Chlamydiota bacterium]
MNSTNRSEFFLRSTKEKDAYHIKEKKPKASQIKRLLKSTSLQAAVLLTEVLKRNEH